ncbi:MAG: hypothetical protein K6E40_12300 [Desulfovibrio sp.]|nr:hypothetical protein [Desulfovibrio sp.]
MQAVHEAGVRTTCSISPIFPGITDPCAIILRARAHCNLVWLENLNLRGGFRKDILDYIHATHPELEGLYSHSCLKGDSIWRHGLDQKMRSFTKEQGLGHVRSDDSMDRPFDAPPVAVNYFFHEAFALSAKMKDRQDAGRGRLHHGSAPGPLDEGCRRHCPARVPRRLGTPARPAQELEHPVCIAGTNARRAVRLNGAEAEGGRAVPSAHSRRAPGSSPSPAQAWRRSALWCRVSVSANTYLGIR